MPRQWPIAREGFPFVAASFAAAAVFALLGWHWTAAVLSAVCAFIVFFFRNPERTITHGDDLVVSPADGRILSVTDVDCAPHGRMPAIKVSIFMSVFNVHVNRMPVAARVQNIDYRPGRFLVASLDKASEHNERNTLVIEDERGRVMSVVQIAGLIARRIVCYARDGDLFDRGARLGLIRFGSRVDLYLPRSCSIEVAPGDRVKAGVHCIGRLT